MKTKAVLRMLGVVAGFVILALCVTDPAWAKVPDQPSDVYVRGYQLMVSRRINNNKLEPAKAYIIKGVGWNPAIKAPTYGPDPFRGALYTLPYGFFLYDPVHNPRAAEVLKYWLEKEHYKNFSPDATMIRRMNANTVRILSVSTDIPMKVLDKFYRKHIMVIMTVALTKSDFDSGKYLQVVNKYKNHPAILMWVIGNGWNADLYGGTMPDRGTAIKYTYDAGLAIKNADNHHPVSTCLSADDMHDFIGMIVVPNIDVIGVNLYRGASFGDFFRVYEQLNSARPFYFCEFGGDSFKVTGYTADAGRAKNCVGAEDQQAQSDFDLGLWRETRPNLSAYDYRKRCLGGLVREYADQVWKVGNYHVGLGGIIDYDHYPTSKAYYIYNPEGFIRPGMPDGTTSEEYFGVVTSDHKAKVVYSALKAFYLTLGAPYIASVTPEAKIGQPFTITGVGFGDTQGQGTVMVGSMLAPVVSWADGSIICTTPNVTKRAHPVVVNAAGTDSNSEKLKVK